jgi:AcrR family transcriptional regulator
MEAVARLGLGNLSLRALARELGVSPRMLLYHFGSRDGLVDATIAETGRRLGTEAASLQGSLHDVVHASWAWISSPRRRGLLKMFYEVCALGARDPARRGSVAATLFTDFHAVLVMRGVPDATATLLLATMHGLALDFMLTGDGERIARALDAFVATLPSASAPARVLA